MPTTRADHLKWCKERARAELNSDPENGVGNAWSSMVSDLGKHPDTEGHIGIELGMMQIMAGHLSTKAAMAKFIDGFN